MKTLYFCSEGHSSMGGTDVFVSKRLSERSWTEWSEPVNMGKAVNSAGNECWYKISTDGSLAYFSKRENKQNDIYQLSIPEHLRPQPVATISGRVVDSNGNPVVTVIRWENLETQRFVGHTRTNPEDGQFFIALPEGKNYGYYIYNEKLFPVSDNIDLRKSDQFISVENNITVTTIKEMIENETPIALNNLFFDTGKWFLLPASISELNRVATIIRQQGIPVEISGHTDDVGDDESNRILSERRANAVRDYLLKAGIDSKLLTAHGYGESRPVATNKTPEGRQKNRRVELKFISSK
ncbi:MAG: OmpA family protein [Paludibacteraceae bacterium]|nr:OmpA family protein [Paludibacteraceae bacterium]